MKIRRIRLRRGHDNHVVYAHMCRSACHKPRGICNVVGYEWSESIVCGGCFFRISAEAHQTEFRFGCAGCNLSYTHSMRQQVDAHVAREHVHSGFCSTLHISSGVGVLACDGTYVDDGATLAGYHPRCHELADV